MDVRRILVAQTNRYAAAVRKLLSIKGEQHEIGYGVHLEDERPEHSFIKGERRWAQFNQATSAAGTLPIIGVKNPPNSGVLVVVTDVFFYSDPVGTYNFETVAGAVTSGTTSMFATDTRWGGQATSAIGFAVLQAAYGGHIVAQMLTLAANQLVDVVSRGARVPAIVLAPNSECAVVGNAVGVQTLSAIFCGYERSLESGELIPA